jgi:hypothetical protein
MIAARQTEMDVVGNIERVKLYSMIKGGSNYVSLLVTATVNRGSFHPMSEGGSG